MNKETYDEIREWVEKKKVDASSCVNECTFIVPPVLFVKDLLTFLEGLVEVCKWEKGSDEIYTGCERVAPIEVDGYEFYSCPYCGKEIEVRDE